MGGDEPNTFDDSPEGRAAAKEYNELQKSIRAVPDGYWGNVSVFVEPTNLGYARFLYEVNRQECEGVIGRLKERLTAYEGEPANGR